VLEARWHRPRRLPTDPPTYIWTGQPTGGAERSEESRADGSFPIANGAAHFHFFGLKFKDVAPRKLRFEYDCYFNPPGSGDGKEQKAAKNGEPCPSGKASASAFLIAFRIGLVGNGEQRKYELTYNCTISGQVIERKNGEYCGEPRFQGTTGINAMTIKLKKK
jgi:hypothetical protein